MARRSDFTTGGPTVRLGTKWPSMTSTWTTPAPPLSAFCDLVGQPAEVGGEDGGGDDHGAGTLLMSRLTWVRAFTRWPAGGICRSTMPGATPG